MNLILTKIKENKLKEIQERISKTSLQALQKSPLFSRSCLSMKENIIDKTQKGIIAEFKRQSPSKGIIHPNADIKQITQGYQASGASAISILNDQKFFGALSTDFEIGRASISLPLLQKDFVLCEYQIAEAKASGADVILLIAKMLKTEEVKRLTHYAHQLGLEVLLETHNAEEIIAHQSTEFDLIGINNRDLNTFKVDIENSIRLAQLLPSYAVKIAESGIDNTESIKHLKENGFSGFLMGEYFMKDKDPAQKLKELIKTLS
ncbi:indole-3-glycerol phosphate synthase TrpC [Myroides injenensis]|uniref:indole-3-glycerol phosphate synthase TrpC n=1 Tax=Myroides injenensis TaxID=1183151 RepID=UPI00028A18F4|nr:indole-3-glycerol phosphate synthase TrpC [Myroides injenensis]